MVTFGIVGIQFVLGTVLRYLCYYAPAPNRRGHKVMMLSDVCLTSDICLSVCLSRTSGLSREQRGLGRMKLAQR